ncbi:hypothetical protein RM844_26325 [Streptomyces sp. DSM 44915]|uniref:AAA+ ATPase domain-containing protein n=1 Tax=Streptomyces chisholmiae TaxID=3075540 RepID=A0ABU2JXS8_9ACTN|nr:hypothetical protein [Streptomyces sp. DSM 44915]MDT0269806.1 hypothetical protein [Streptomyces sp. DSM 44915]
MAQQVSAGFAVSGEAWDSAAAWLVERTLLTERLRSLGLTWADDEGFAELDERVTRWRAQRKVEEVAARVAELEAQRDDLEQLLERADQNGGAHRDLLRSSLTALNKEIATLRPDLPAPSPERTPVPDTGAETTGEARDDTPQAVVMPGPRVTEDAQPEVETLLAQASSQSASTTLDETTPGLDSRPTEPDEPATREVATDASRERDVSTRPADPGEPATQIQLADGNLTAGALASRSTIETERYLPWEPAAGEHDGAQGVSVVAQLVDAGRLQEAYWLTVASAEPAHRAECLAFAQAAFACEAPEEATSVMRRFTPDLDTLRGDRAALVLAGVSSLRASLVVGWSNDLLLQSELSSATPGAWGRLLASAGDVLRRHQPVTPAALRLSGNTGPALDRADIAARASELAADLPRRRIGYARATQVQNRLMGADQPLGRTLKAIQDWAAGRDDQSVLDDVWDLFRKRDSAERMIEEADAAIRTPKQAREPIEAKAKRTLLNRVEHVATLLSQARALAAPGLEERGDSVTTLTQALAQVRDLPVPPGVPGAALGRLRAWLLGDKQGQIPHELIDLGDGATGTDAAPAPRPGAEALLAAPDLPRSPDGEPLADQPGFAQAVAALLEPVDIRAVVTTYAERGDLHLVDALAEALAHGLVPAAPEGTDELPSDWRTLRDDEWSRWSRLRSARHRKASDLLAELRTQQSLGALTERELVARLARLEQPTPEGAFRSCVAEIDELQRELRVRIQSHITHLREQLAALDLSDQDKRRLTGLLRAGDTVTAEECLSLLRKGESLPDWSGANRADDLAEFMAGLENTAARKAGQQGYSARPWADRYANGQPLTEGARVGLESWDALSKPTTRGSEWQKHVPVVLRLLGLEGRTPTRDDHRQVRGILRLSARLSVSESAPGYVAALGSAATTFTVLVVSEELRGRSPLELLDRSDTGACVILYLYPLGLSGRRGMAARARTSAQQALVVDPATLGWIAARSPRSFRAVQRVTLPWTTFNPYTPFVAGLVPPEVFYGRTKEMAAVTDPLGALFLYGGRQLGKSALLRKVEADFPTTPDHKAVYLDLKARGVGEAEPAERIWSVLAGELKRVGVIRPEVSSEVGQKALLDEVEQWLLEKRERRVLVLADEADAFLTADSKAVRGQGGEGTFANVVQLKGLMDNTDRRFKVVFAGLHQVQRFSQLSNVPTAHGGPDVLIGPLKPAEAQRLVVEPMAAFGYRFERPELVWRVLAATNYQACLVQIFCEQLVSALREKPLGSAQWPITVTEEDVRSVAGSAQVHRNIAERLRLTINLEDRYRVLALVIALRSQADRFQQGYDADELLNEAKRNWPEGFRRLTASDVEIYLDEMVGLGLLIQQADRRNYAVRSPNVVHMLGTREDLELELRQTEFSLPYDYNPRFSRRLVGQDQEGVTRYSPLTEQQLSEAVTSSGVSVVCMTKAHGPELVAAAITSYASAREVEVRTADQSSLMSVLAKDARGRRPSVIVSDLRYCGLTTLATSIEHMVAHTSRDSGPHRAAVLLVDPRALGRLPDERVTRVLRPERWSADSLRAWPECPFDTPDKRRRLVEATGGWPSLVERTVHLATRGGATLETALEQIREFCAQPERARQHLERVELDQEMLKPLSTWVQYLDPGEPCDQGDIAAVTEIPLDQIHRLTTRLTDHGVLDDGEDGFALDLATFRALSVAGSNQ